jgi:histone H3/H4
VTDEVLAEAEKLKKPLTGYFLFLAENRERVKASMPDAGVGPVAKALGAEWRTLDEEKKKAFVDEAAQQKKTYLAALEKMGLTPASLKKRKLQQKAAGSAGAGGDEKTSVNSKGFIMLSAASQLTLPVSRIKKLMQVNPKLNKMAKQATEAATYATELFCQLIGKAVFMQTNHAGRKTMKIEDCGDALRRSREFDFLTPTLHALPHSDVRTKSLPRFTAARFIAAMADPSSCGKGKKKGSSSSKKKSKVAAGASKSQPSISSMIKTAKQA